MRRRILLQNLISRHSLAYMKTPILDEFTHLPISRQRRYQLRKKRDGRCTECGAPADKGPLCLKHLVMMRELHRKLRRAKRRYKSLSYRLQLKLGPKRIDILARFSESEHQKAIALLEEFKNTGRGGKAFAEQNARALNILSQLRGATG
jgi:hypothetical protein